VDAGVTVPMIVVRDIAPEVMPTVDAEARRTYADAPRVAGGENTSVLAWLFSDLDPDEAGEFLSHLADGDGLATDDPIAALRNRVVNMRVSGGRVNETEAIALLVMAWNARRAGERRTKLQLPRGGLTAENFPEPR
jgi:hypothetical protein